MNRRTALGLITTFPTAGIAGCTRFDLRRQQHRLWFVRIHNGSLLEANVTVRVLRNGENVFERTYEKIPSFRAVDQGDDPEATFAAMPNARLIEYDWEMNPAVFDVEYLLASQDSWERLEVASDDAVDVGVAIDILGGHTRRSTPTRHLEFDSEEQAAWFLDEVTDQIDREGERE